MAHVGLNIHTNDNTLPEVREFPHPDNPQDSFVIVSYTEDEATVNLFFHSVDAIQHLIDRLAEAQWFLSGQKEGYRA